MINICLALYFGLGNNNYYNIIMFGLFSRFTYELVNIFEINSQ